MIINKIQSLITRYQNDLIDFCSDLVKTPSVVGEDTEEQITKVVEDKAKELDLSYKIITKIKHRPNIFVGKNFDKKSGLLFVAHLDTAAVGNKDKWKHDPFGAEIENGKMYGRGTIDCKVGVALSLFTLKILKDLGLEDKAKFAGVVDEEKGADSKIGARYLLDSGLKALAAIYTYSGTDTITIGHRGQVKVWVKVRGESAHSGSRGWQEGTRGASAIDALINFLNQAAKINFKGTEPNFPGYGFKQTVVFVNGGTISGMVPDYAKALIDARFLPSQDNNKYIDQVINLSKKFDTDKIKFDIGIHTNLPGALINPKEKIVGVLKRLVNEILKSEPEIRGCGPANEGYMFIGTGIPTICGFGAHGDGAHAADEYLDLESLPKILETYIRSALEF